MSDIVLYVSGLGKCYATYRNNLARFAQWFGFPARHTHEYWALKDVNFTLRQGEALAIIGQNGAGKSTLLKLITGTVRPTTGSVQINGRVSAILELGLGFNPDFTGRQNVYLAGGLMGLSTAELTALIPGIEEFAEIGEFFDQPLRVYSSGMQARLAFAVATAERPDILIVDEALSVGDAAFQRKCFRQIEDFRLEGTSLLFVTHDTETTKRICERAIWIHHGRVELASDSKAVCESYERHLFGFLAKANSIKQQEEKIGAIDQTLDASSIEASYGGELAEIIDFSIRNRHDQIVNVIPIREPFIIKYRVQFHENCEGVNFGMMVKTVDGVCVFAFNTEHRECLTEFLAGEIAQVSFELQNHLVAGTYYLNCGANHMTEKGRIFLHRRLDVGILRVTAYDKLDSLGGIANLQAEPMVTIETSSTGRA